MMYINGHWVNAVSGSIFAVHNPSNNEKIGEAADGNQDDARQAIEAAPFGGMKESGLGREGGQEGIAEYLETKLGGVPYNKT